MQTYKIDIIIYAHIMVHHPRYCGKYHVPQLWACTWSCDSLLTSKLIAAALPRCLVIVQNIFLNLCKNLFILAILLISDAYKFLFSIVTMKGGLEHTFGALLSS